MLIGKQQSYPCLHYNICSSPYSNEQASTCFLYAMSQLLMGFSLDVTPLGHCECCPGCALHNSGGCHLHDSLFWTKICSNSETTSSPHTLLLNCVFLSVLYSGLLVGLSNVCVCICKEGEKKKKRERRGGRETDWREEGKQEV